MSDYLHRIYLIGLQIRDATYTIRSALYVDTHPEIDNEVRLRTKPYDKTDDFNHPIVNFPLYVATFQQYLHMEYIPFSWYNITDIVVPIIIANKETTKPRVPKVEVEVIIVCFIIVLNVYRCYRFVFNVYQLFITVFNVYQCCRCVFSLYQWFIIGFNVYQCHRCMINVYQWFIIVVNVISVVDMSLVCISGS